MTLALRAQFQFEFRSANTSRPFAPSARHTMGNRGNRSADSNSSEAVESVREEAEAWNRLSPMQKERARGWEKLTPAEKEDWRNELSHEEEEFAREKRASLIRHERLRLRRQWVNRTHPTVKFGKAPPGNTIMTKDINRKSRNISKELFMILMEMINRTVIANLKAREGIIVDKRGRPVKKSRRPHRRYRRGKKPKPVASQPRKKSAASPRGKKSAATSPASADVKDEIDWMDPENSTQRMILEDDDISTE